MVKANEEVAPPSRRGINCLPFESTERAREGCMIKNDSARNAKECVYEESLMSDMFLV